MKKILIGFLGAALGCLTAQASITLTLEGGVLRTDTGTIAPDGGLILLVASTTDSIFSATLDGNASTSVGSF
jgi:hypothetical protein